MNEKEVIQQFKNGDAAAFEFLYKRYWQKVYNFSKLYITSSSDVEEIVQEVFTKLWEVRAFVDENKNFQGFLFIVTRNIIFNKSRRSFNKDFFQITVVEAVVDSYDIEEELEASDLNQYFQSLIAMLSPRQQQVFHLSREEHLTYKQIAQRLHISEKTVEHHISDVLKFLKKNMQLYIIFIAL